ATGGTTPFVIGALELARQMGAGTGFLLCTAEADVDMEVDVIIPVVVGPEVITGSTRMKAGTATKLVLNMISTTTMVQLHKTYSNLMVDLTALNDKLWDRGSRIIAELTGRDYDAALALLKEADGEVKAALVMHHQGVSLTEAHQSLAAARGDLRRVLEWEEER
ncbi:MAG: N-acetylmuramic acid 6-phosphate etherase, partial [Candidatus Neomarinimicrobiota bacterium]